MGEENRMNYNFFIELNSLALIFVISRFSFSNRYIAIIFDYSIFKRVHESPTRDGARMKKFYFYMLRQRVNVMVEARASPIRFH